ncbi:MAG: Mur ligase [Holophagaceae bacterium]|nr:Mur ligase [Holophagaceae bacterium]
MSGTVPTPFEDSRRLTGPNLLFGSCGAVLEAPLPGGGREEAHAKWARLVEAMRSRLGWPGGPVTARVHASGATLAFAAPEDLLFAATEVNEWAWTRALEETTGTLSLRLSAPGHPAVWDEDSAVATMRAMSAAEVRPGLMALLREAQHRNLPAFLDEETLSIGAGSGHMAWRMDTLPAPADVAWGRLHGIPTVLVTGSNGKTTSVRLLAAMAASQGWRLGHTCTDGIYIAGELVEAGDYSGPGGARAVLRDVRVEAAILETARGGILRRGLSTRQADVALVTNVSPEHFGEYGIHSLEDLADVKLVVAKALASGGLLVLNADDGGLVARASTLACPIGWFSLEDGHPLLQRHRAASGATCAVRDGRLRLHWKDRSHDLGAVASMPLSAGGHAAYNVSNLAGAALAAAGLGIPPLAIAGVLAAFGASRGDNPGRLEIWRFGGITIFMDYAHNPEGLEGLLKLAAQVRGPGRIGLLLGQAGNREDGAIRALAATAAGFDPDFVVLKDIEGFLRGREPGEVAALLWKALAAEGVEAERLRTVLPEAEAALSLVGWARAGDVVVLPVHGAKARTAVAAKLDRLEAGGWRAGDPVGC